jgi:hypothetical protein
MFYDILVPWDVKFTLIENVKVENLHKEPYMHYLSI